MFILARAVTWATLFIGVVLILVPARVLSSSGIISPAAIGLWQVAGMLAGAAGAAIALSCIFTLCSSGGELPPRSIHLVDWWFRVPIVSCGIRCTSVPAWPWRVRRFYQSLALLSYVGFFFVVTHLFVVAYEEPTLRRTFGGDYDVYCERAGRWWPKRGF